MDPDARTLIAALCPDCDGGGHALSYLDAVVACPACTGEGLVLGPAAARRRRPRPPRVVRRRRRQLAERVA